MAIKIVQDTAIPRVNTTVGVASTSVPISLRTGYLRITIGSTGSGAGGYVAIGTNPVVNRNCFHVVPYGTDIIKETLRNQRIAGVTTGTTTTINFGENNGNTFASNDYVTVSGAASAGINTTHVAILSMTDNTITIAHNSSSVTSPDITGGIVSRSIKVACLTDDPSAFFNISEVVTLVAE